MKVQLSFRTTVTYSAEVDMTAAQWMQWNQELEANPRGAAYNRVCQRLFDRHFKLGEPSDFDDPELDDFTEVRPSDHSAGEKP